MFYTLAELARSPRPAGEAIAEIGGKAHHLAQLVAAGLPVPQAVVIPEGAALDGEIDAAIDALGAPLAVRSSSPLEDRDEHAAPGLFPSYTGVARDDVAAAVVDVRAAATSELALAYAEATDRPPAGMAVVIQRYIAPTAAGTAYSRAPGRSDVMLIEPRVDAGEPVTGALVEIARDGEPPGRWAALFAAVLEAERAIGAEAGADVEWVEDGEALWLVQARPLRPTAPRSEPPAEAFDFAAADERITWRLDLRHNPEPLSPAQQGLVAEVVERDGAPLALACGYLYEAVARPGDAPNDGDGDGDELEALFFERVEPALDRRLQTLESAPPDLEAAIDLFAAVHRDYGVVAARLSALRRQVADTPARLGSARAHAAALASDSRAAPATRARARRLAGLSPAEFYAPYAIAWDVAAPLLSAGDIDDRPARIVDRDAPSERAWLADLGAAVAELDDRLFYRAQALVRRALLDRGRQPDHPDPLGDDVFWLPLSDVRAGRLHDAGARARRARADHERARALSMPLELRGTRWTRAGAAVDRRLLRGRGFGGRATGPIRLCPAGAAPVASGDILCAIDLTPADVIAGRNAAGIALESGSLLGHAAAMARELEIPIVVQIPGLCGLVVDGERAVIDGERGVLLRASEGR